LGNANHTVWQPWVATLINQNNSFNVEMHWITIDNVRNVI
jgi:hypothetical protein